MAQERRQGKNAEQRLGGATDPGDRLHVGRMNGEEERREKREKKIAEEPPRDEEGQDRVQAVQEHRLEVVSERIQAPEGVVHHVRDEVEREIVREVGLREYVDEILARQSADPRVVDDVGGVVPAREEPVVKRL